MNDRGDVQLITAEQIRLDPCAFADAVLKRNEKGQPWSLSQHQRRVMARAFRRSPDGRLLFRTVLWAEQKKTGKTFIAAVLGLWLGFTNPRTEIIVAANDLGNRPGEFFEP